MSTSTFSAPEVCVELKIEAIVLSPFLPKDMFKV